MTSRSARSPSSSSLGSSRPPTHWLLDLPDSPTVVHIRQFALPSSLTDDAPPPQHAESSADAQRRILRAARREDALEVAWRAVNAQGRNEDEVAGKVLMGPCAVIVSPNKAKVKGEVGDGEGDDSGRGRVLWLFDVRGPNASEGDQYHHEALEGLQALPSGPPIPISSLLVCRLHGQGAACLAARPPTCDVRFSPEGVHHEWDIFARSVVEKLAWRMGQRTCMSDDPPYLANLRPLAENRLLLSFRTRNRRRIPSEPTTTTTTPVNAAKVLLLPLRLPAYRIAPHSPTPEQAAELDNSFTVALGHGWKRAQEHWRLAQQVSGGDTSDWAVFWVPVPPPRTDGLAETALPAAPTGVLTVWPSHLIGSPRPLARPKRKRNPGIVSSTDQMDLMAASAQLFDFYSTYKEPKPPPPEPEEDAKVDMMTPASRPGGDSSGAAPGPSASDADKARSEIDDLFSSRSASLDPDAATAAANAGNLGATAAVDAPATATPVTREQEEAALASFVGLGEDVVMDGATPPPMEISSRVSSFGNEDPMVAITEDDFDFFDSPEAKAEKERASLRAELEADVAIEVGEAVQAEAGGEADLAPGESALQPAEGPASQPQPHPPLGQQQPENELAPVPNGSGDTADVVAASANQPPTPPPDAEDSAPGDSLRSGVRFEQSATPSPPPKSQLGNGYDLIPSSFCALPIRPPKRPAAHSILPLSPAPSPEALRLDLVERLRASKKKAKFDYASAWNMDESPSDTEAEYDKTAGPPTPESEDAWADSTGAPTPAEELAQVDDGVEFEGVPCLGAEWVWLVRDEEAGAEADEARARGLGVPWKTAWGPVPPVVMSQADEEVDVKPKVPLEEVPRVEDNALARRCAVELVANRVFRAAWLGETETKALGGGAEDEGGIGLNDSAGPDEMADGLPVYDASELAHHTAPAGMTCDVHAGFGGNVLRLAIAGVGYWRQLGLSPAGGEKDVEAVIVTLPGPAYTRAAESVMAGLQKSWAELRLGSHSARAEHPVVAASLETFAPTISAAMTPKSGVDVVIYLLVGEDAISSASLADVLKLPAKQGCLVHVLCTTIQPRQYPDLVFDVYNRLSRSVRRASTEFPPSPFIETVSYHYPSFTLAPDALARPALSMTWPLRSYDVLNRWRLVHAAYARDAASGLTVAFVMDAEGENWDVRTWRSSPTSTSGGKGHSHSHEALAEALELVWDFIADFAATAALEWRVALVCLGRPVMGEMEAWAGIVRPSTPFTVLVAESGRDVDAESASASATGVRPPVPPANIGPAVLADGGTRIVDDTLAYRVGRMRTRVPLDYASDGHPDSGGQGKGKEMGDEAVYPVMSWVSSLSPAPASASSDGDGDGRSDTDSPASLSVSRQRRHGREHVRTIPTTTTTTTTFHVLLHTPAPGKGAEAVDELLGREYQKLTYLARMRFGFARAVMPVHLEAVRVCMRGLSAR